MLILCKNCFALDAFPGAVGYGKTTAGGRGGTVYIVDQLGDNAAAEAAGTTFREAVTASGARYVVFAVSGIIQLESTLWLSNPFITIAGETSPGGVMITGYTFAINTHDIIMRNMRIRVGTQNISTCTVSESLDSLGIYGQEWYANIAYNIIIDHCSIGWGVDETVAITGGVNGLTMQNCIIHEGLYGNVGAGNGCDGGAYLHPDGAHSKGLMISGKYREDQACTLFANYICHNYDRNPLLYAEMLYDSAGNLVTNGNLQYIDGANNVTYNFDGGNTAHVEGHLFVNWVHNYVKRGWNNDHDYLTEASDPRDTVFELGFFNRWDGPKGLSGPGGGEEALIYSYNNIGTGSTGNADWNVGWYWRTTETYYDAANDLSYDSNDWKASSAWDFDDLVTDAGTDDEFTAVFYPLSPTAMTYSVAQSVVANAGALKPSRDSIDTRLASDFTNGTGRILATVTYPTDYPTYSTPSAPADTDTDGMADAWEVIMYGDLSQTATGDYNSDGYDNIETYIHSLVGASTPTISVGAGTTVTVGAGTVITVGAN